jgi:hypothetical protein
VSSGKEKSNSERWAGVSNSITCGIVCIGIYEEFILRVAQHPIAAKIKLANLRDNMDITRLTEVDDAAMERLQRYRRAWQTLHNSPLPEERRHRQS